MPLTKEHFVAQLDRAAAGMGEFPVSCGILRRLSEELKRGEPRWWLGTKKAWERREFLAWAEPWALFLSALHFEALSDADNPLVPFFPSCGGTDEADPSPGLAEFLGDPPRRFYENLRDRQRRSYIRWRSLQWLGPATCAFAERSLPFYLVQVNAGAGLDLAVDLVEPRPRFKSDLVAARVGLDQQPLNLEDIAHRRWMTASIPPEQAGLITELDAAIDKVRDELHRDPNFVQLVCCDADRAPKFVAKNVPADDTDVGLLVFNIATTVRMSDPEYERFARAMFETLLPWGDRAIWVEIESVRGELYSDTLQIRVHRAGKNALGSLVAGSWDPARNVFSLDQDRLSEFLRPSPAAK